MIRINLAPRKKRGARSHAPSRSGFPPHVWLLFIVVGWALILGACWWFLDIERKAEARLRVEVSDTNKKIEAVKKEIDEQGLKERETQVAEMEVAISKLSAKRRTPVYVMYELAMILTDSQQGGGPDVDQEKYRQLTSADPQSAINDRWDPTGLWLKSIAESSGTLTIDGEARDASDLTEFTRRLRASARFSDLSNPDFQRVGNPADDARYLTWKLAVQVRRWN